jgi:valyl-tRNA synthetase
MDKSYNHKVFEDKIYKKWEDSGAFSPDLDPKNQTLKPFCIIMPPPNANDPLHIGHARFVAIEDVLIRYHRMRGEPTLWLPGSDHAGIETQYVFEKKLAKENKSRFDFDNDTLYKMIWNYVQDNTGVMEEQLKKIGASCDWSRFKFTLDPDIVKVVYSTFKKLFDDGLVYRGERIVNYCIKCGTSYSQLEVDSVEQDDNIYYLDYGTVTIATTRPETIFADVAIAVNPEDKKLKGTVGLTAKIPLINRDIPIIGDKDVDMSFGSGALKITPAHDAADFEIGQTHNLPILKVIDAKGKMINCPDKYIGMKVSVARSEVVKDLESSGKLKKVEKIHHTISTCYRDHSVLEPTISTQWFIKVEPLAKKALKAIAGKDTIFPADKYRKIAVHWLKNLRDWNISRQIVWGIRIPAWICNKCAKWTITDGSPPKKCEHCRHDKLVQDTDTFDTWFSSGQWPYATLKTTFSGDFEKFYPTSLMNTGYDILPFWVIRMLILGIYTTRRVPFKTVLLHGLVRDKAGLKISKSKGNVINPIEMVDKYGSDALRMGLLWGALIENDVAMSEEKINGQRKFANKVWNVARYVLSQNLQTNPQNTKNSNKNKDDIWILSELDKTTKTLTESLDSYRLNEAAESIYDFVWHKFADKYIESCKLRIANSDTGATSTLSFVLDKTLRLLHPFMPFVTEAIWQEMGNKDLIITSEWPQI